jgi:hypothetical protein
VAVTIRTNPNVATATLNPRDTLIALGCLALFALPFASVGVTTAGMALKRASEGTGSKRACSPYSRSRSAGLEWDSSCSPASLGAR